MSECLYKGNQVELRVADNVLSIVGAPGFDNARKLAEAGKDWLSAGHSKEVIFDVTDTETVNSGVLCVLLEWLRQARDRDVSVVDIRLPERLEELVRVSGLASVLGLDESKKSVA